MGENDDNSGDDQSNDERPTTPSEEAGTPSGPELAGRGRRLGAYLIDSIIAGIVLAVVAYLNLGISFADITRDPMTQQMPIAGSIGFLVIFMAINSYLLVTKGQTLGKRMLGIRIVDAVSNGAATAVKLLGLRYVLVLLVMAIPMIGQALGLIDVLFIFRSDRRCVHDLLAGTKVVSNS
ncbi:MAG TPA: RDD family protein [Gammaproteobacteria bacterium]|nr:RDD family protein [Gammaproteobacteria bacterium]